MQPDRLVYMANQIGQFFQYQFDSSEQGAPVSRLRHNRIPNRIVEDDDPARSNPLEEIVSHLVGFPVAPVLYLGVPQHRLVSEAAHRPKGAG